MQFDFAEILPQNRYKLLLSTVVPRPIAWVVTKDNQGRPNAAPFSFFNLFSTEPPIICLGITKSPTGGNKDTIENIQATNEFVINLVSDKTAQAMNITAVDFERGHSEIETAQLTMAPSLRVSPPRLAESPVALECSHKQTIELAPNRYLVVGNVIAMYVQDDFILDKEKFYIDTPNLKLISRMHGRGWYARTSDLFEMPRISLEQWNSQKKG